MTRRSRIVWVILGLLVFYAGLWDMSQWWDDRDWHHDS